MNDEPETDVDGEFAKLLGAQNAHAQQALSASMGLADLLVAFRIKLLIGGFPPETAEELAKDYFNAILDQMSGPTPEPEA